MTVYQLKRGINLHSQVIVFNEARSSALPSVSAERACPVPGHTNHYKENGLRTYEDGEDRGHEPPVRSHSVLPTTLLLMSVVDGEEACIIPCRDVVLVDRFTDTRLLLWRRERTPYYHNILTDTIASTKHSDDRDIWTLVTFSVQLGHKSGPRSRSPCYARSKLDALRLGPFVPSDRSTAIHLSTLNVSGRSLRGSDLVAVGVDAGIPASDILAADVAASVLHVKPQHRVRIDDRNCLGAPDVSHDNSPSVPRVRCCPGCFPRSTRTGNANGVGRSDHSVLPCTCIASKTAIYKLYAHRVKTAAVQTLATLDAVHITLSGSPTSQSLCHAHTTTVPAQASRKPIGADVRLLRLHKPKSRSSYLLSHECDFASVMKMMP